MLTAKIVNINTLQKFVQLLYVWVHHFYQGKQLLDILFTFLDNKAVMKLGSVLKEFAPRWGNMKVGRMHIQEC